MKNFWKDIIYKDGKLDEKAVLNELSDYEGLLKEVPKVYCAVTKSRISKANTVSEAVIGEFESLFLDKSMTQDDLRDMIERCEDVQDLKNELISYFDLLEDED